jgi:hypothetical protein
VAVTFDAVGPSSSGQVSTGANLTWNHTCGTGATALYVGVGVDTSNSGITASATYNGVAMTSMGLQASGGSGETSGYLQVFKMESPPTGAAHAVLVTATAGTPDSMEAGSVSVTGSSSEGTVFTSSSSGSVVTSGSVAVTGTTSGNLIIGFLVNGSGGTSFTSGTSRFIANGTHDNAAGTAACATSASSGGTVTIGWSQTLDWYGAIGFEVQAGGTSATVSGVTAAASTQGVPGTVTASSNASVTGAVAAVPAISAPGLVSGSASVTGTTAVLSAGAAPGTVSGTSNAAITGAVSLVAGSALPGSASGSAGVTGAVAGISAAPRAGTVSGTAAVSGLVSPVAGNAPAGSVSGSASVTGVPVVSGLTAPAGTVTGTTVSNAAVTGAVALMAAAAAAGSVTVSAAVPGSVAACQVSGIAGSITLGAAVSLSGSGFLAVAAVDLSKYGAVTLSGHGSFAPVVTAPADTRPALHLGGILTAPVFGGTILSADSPGGTIVAAGNDFGGTVTAVDAADSSVTATWASLQADIIIAEWNDQVYSLSLTSGGAAYDLTGAELDMFLKPQAGIADNAPGVVKLSTVTGEIVITDAVNGEASVVVPSDDTGSANAYSFYRVDAVVDSKRSTALYGNVSTTPL